LPSLGGEKGFFKLIIMPVKIRLQRHGRKGKPFYHIVVADSRAPRDGKFIEKIGIYNPLTNPATIELNLDLAVSWLKNGAQPTDTTHAILSYKGALYKRHLDVGVQKGSLSVEAADEKFKIWSDAKQQKVDGKKSSLLSVKDVGEKARLLAETQIKEDRTKAIVAKKAAAEAALNPVAEAQSEEAPATEEEEETTQPE